MRPESCRTGAAGRSRSEARTRSSGGFAVVRAVSVFIAFINLVSRTGVSFCSGTSPSSGRILESRKKV